MEMAATTASSLEAEHDNVLVNAARHKLTTVGLVNTVRLNLMLSVQVNVVKGDFINTSIKVAFLDKPEESEGFKQIINFLNASSIRYALTMNPTIYTTCIKQFWATTKVKKVNEECQIQDLVDKKRVIITEKSVRSDLMLEDAKGIGCLLNDGGVKFLMYPRFVQVFLDNQVEGMTKHKWIYVTPSHTKKVFANMKREGKRFSGKVTPLFQTMMVQAPEDMGKDLAAPTDSHSTPIITQPLSSKPQKKKSRRKQRKDNGPTEPIPDEATNEDPISTPYYDPSQSEESQAIGKEKKSRTSGLKRLRKVGSASRVESSNDVSLGTQEDASKQGRKIADLDADEEVTLIDETQERNDEEMLFDVQDDLQGEEVVAAKEVTEKEVSAADLVTTVGEVVTTANVKVTTANAPTTTIDKLTLAQTLIEIIAAKPKDITTAATTTTTTRPKARGDVVQDASEFKTTSSSSQASQLLQVKDKGKAKIVKPEKPSKKKDQIALDEELALRLHAEEQAELERMQKEKVAQEEASRATVIEELDSI
ncbi:hypothetical protein Tco_1273321 [Tanacetum coccineum]